MENKEKLYLELGKTTFEKLDALAQSEDENAPELDFFLADGSVLELMNQIASESTAPEASAPLVQHQTVSAGCSKCGAPKLQDAKFCNLGGANLSELEAAQQVPQPTMLQCPHCGKELRPSAAFCTGCGNKVCQ